MNKISVGSRIKFTLSEIAQLGVLGALMFGAQVALAGLPNIEVVALLVIIFTLHYERKALYIIYLFVLLEGLAYGFGLWWISYLYLWTILYGVARLFRKNTWALGWGIIAGFFGLLFGTLSSVPYFFTGGLGGGVAYIVSGIPFDLVHCAGNFVLVTTLYTPLTRLLEKVRQATRKL